MARSTARRVALLSIHPEYADAILAGTKRVELRRTTFAEDVSHVVIYATSPVRRVVGWFEVASIDRDRPSRLWDKYRAWAGLSRERFRHYYRNTREGTAILVGETRVLTSPVSLSHLRVASPPQSFQYMGPEVLAELIPSTEA